MSPVDYAKIKVGLQQLDDAILDLGSLKKPNRRYGDKNVILKALGDKDYPTLREISNYFYEVSGIYERICRYFAYLYRYDWFVVPYVEEDDRDAQPAQPVDEFGNPVKRTISKKNEKVLADFTRVLAYLDNSNVKKLLGDIALKVIKDGCYYGYIIDSHNSIVLQDLPPAYCRSRYKVGGVPAVEFNMKFFDDKFGDLQYRMRVLNLFPEEFRKGYLAYKQGRLKGDHQNDTTGWYLLDVANTVKFNLNGSDFPMLANAIPNILDLDAAQDLDRRKTMQKLLKIIIQKLPLDKNGDLIFDPDEAKDIHNNTVQMLKRAVGVDVMTTFADVDVADLADKNTTTSTDDLAKVERTLYNSLGVSQNLFNSDGNLALNHSIVNDETSMRDLLMQFQIFLNRIIERKVPAKKKYSFRLFILETTAYNYQELAKQYKEQVQIGYSKMLPQVAMGHSQSAIIAMAHFENEILDLPSIMIPPLMSSTMKGEDILGKKNQPNSQGNQTSEKSSGGRPEKADSQKSEKTIKNKEAMS